MKIHTRQGTPRLLHELHTVGGVYVMIILLVIALTGLTWSFEWYGKGFYKLFGVEQKQEKKGDKSGHEGKGKDKDKDHAKGDQPEEALSPLPKTYQLWPAVYTQVLATKANHPQVTLKEDKAEGSLSPIGNIRANDTYHFDTTTGQITRIERYADAPASKGARGWVYSVHTGAWGGWLTKLIWVIAALFGWTLPLTGFYLLIRRKRMEAKEGSKGKKQGDI